MITGFFFVIGAALGSFSLVLAWRTHDEKNWVTGRSECDECHKVLQPADMVPVFSWLALGGRCRYCKKKISPQLLLAELLLGTTAALSFAFWPLELNSVLSWSYFGLWIIILTVLSALFWFDLNWKELPSNLMRALIVLAFGEGLLQLLVEKSFSFSAVFAVLMSGLLLAGLFWLIYYFSKGRLIGDGDAPLVIGLGFIAGTPLNAFLLLFIASILGTVITLPFMAVKKLKLKSQIPFGPLLITAAVIVQLFGSQIADWYIGLAGL